MVSECDVTLQYVMENYTKERIDLYINELKLEHQAEYEKWWANKGYTPFRDNPIAAKIGELDYMITRLMKDFFDREVHYDIKKKEWVG